MVLERSTWPIMDDGLVYRFYNNSKGQPIYECVAEGGSATSAAVWRIRKFTYDGNGAVNSILLADGNKNFDNVADTRTSYTYS